MRPQGAARAANERQRAGRLLRDGEHLYRLEGAGLRVPCADPAVASGRPQRPVRARRQRGDLGAARAVRVARSAARPREGLGGAREPHEAARRADPERAAGVFGERGDAVAGERGGIVRDVAVRREAGAVVAVEAVLRAEPQVPLPVLHDGVDEPVTGADTVEAGAGLGAGGGRQQDESEGAEHGLGVNAQPTTPAEAVRPCGGARSDGRLAAPQFLHDVVHAPAEVAPEGAERDAHPLRREVLRRRRL